MGLSSKMSILWKFEFKTLYAQFWNGPVGRRKVFLSESNEVTKSDICIQEKRQRWYYECSLAAAAHISNRPERETLH